MTSKLAPPTPGFKDLPAKDRILLTAHDLFYREGIRATGVDLLIRESRVTKVTFYRHFPSKNDLILAFLNYRHDLWMNWFTTVIETHGNKPEAIVDALSEWFLDADYRGCAFINSVGEIGREIPEVMEISRQHKNEMAELIMKVLPESTQRQQDVQAIALAIDGAIVRAQYETDTRAVLQAFARLLNALLDQQ
jgi:AcrR family transcriptional regulator